MIPKLVSEIVHSLLIHSTARRRRSFLARDANWSQDLAANNHRATSHLQPRTDTNNEQVPEKSISFNLLDPDEGQVVMCPKRS